MRTGAETDEERRYRGFTDILNPWGRKPNGMDDDTPGGNRPSVGILGYGSLLSPDELVPFLETDASRVTPVRVEGFRRVFNQESVWRAKVTDGGEDEIGVLNAVRDRGSSMNAVLVPDLSSDEYEALRVRESGYRMVEAEKEAIGHYAEDEKGSLPEDDVVLVPTGNRVNDDVLPIPEYVEVCLEGARHWGESFRDEFLRTTEVRGGETLAEYIGEGE